MKKTALFLVLILIFIFLSSSTILAERNDDFQTIKKAVKKNPSYKGQEVKWFKVLITDAKTKKDRVRITLPISLIELFLKCAKDKHWHFDDEWECDVDVEKLFYELKKLGPMALVEIYEEDEIIRVWLE
ncbi:MAG: hypothetical protein ACE5LC_02265 [Candidatus Aminicenantales bacterium]